MDIRLLILPGAILAIHTIFILLKMAMARKAAARSGRVDAKYFRTYQGYDCPDDLKVMERHYSNLLELPVIYYFALFVAITLNLTSMLNVVLAWAYLVLRLVHTLIHLNGNRVKYRFQIFGVGVLVLSLFWLNILYGLFASWN